MCEFFFHLISTSISNPHGTTDPATDPKFIPIEIRGGPRIPTDPARIPDFSPMVPRIPSKNNKLKKNRYEVSIFFFNFLFFDGIRGTMGDKFGIRAGSVGIRGPPFISMGINLGSVAGSVVPWGLEIDVGITGKKTHTPTHLHAYTHTRTPTIARETHTDSD